MPILPREPDVFPDDLLEPGGWKGSVGTRWWAVYTLARREKDLMRRLRSLEIAHYGPLVRHRSRSPKGRPQESYIPLFPGYVFLCGEPHQQREAMKTNCVSQCLEVPDGDRLVADLRKIQQMIASDEPLYPEEKLQPGTLGRIRSGSMAGLEGRVVRRHGKDWLVVTVEFLQQGASVLLEDFQFEQI